MTGIERISKERKRQIEEEGWTPKHDDKHTGGEMSCAAAVYAMPGYIRCVEVPVAVNASERTDVLIWPWGKSWYKPTPNDRIRELEKAGALIAAEIDRLQREESE